MKKRKLKLKKNAVAVLVAVLILVAFAVSLYVRNIINTFVYNKHLDEVAVSVDETDIMFREASFYIMTVEKQINELALTYNSDNPNEFWNTYFSAGLNKSQFTRDYAKDTAQQLCAYDYIMEKEAIAKKVFLSDGEKAASHEEAKDDYDKMSDYELKQTGLDEQIMNTIYERRALVKKYLENAVDEINDNGFDGDAAGQLSYIGEYYLDYIYTKYNVKYSDIWNKIVMGKITLKLKKMENM